MPFNLHGRHFLRMLDFSRDEFVYLLDLAAKLKADKRAGLCGRTLAGKNIALIFEKASTRTRCAFTVAAVDEGGHAEYLGKDDIQLGKKESVKDTARVLGRMFDGIQFRGYAHETVEELARWAGVPVWNGLTDRFHPTQVLADFQTVQEQFGRELRGVAFTYVGDGRNNVANSLMEGAAILGMDFRNATPASLFPDKRLVAECKAVAAKSGGKITITKSRGGSGEALAGDLYGRVGLHGRRGQDSGAHQALEGLQGHVEDDEDDRPRRRDLPALPPLLPRSRNGSRAQVPGDLRGGRRGVRERGVARVRRGREPRAHDQSGDGRDDREMSARRGTPNVGSRAVDVPTGDTIL